MATTEKIVSGPSMFDLAVGLFHSDPDGKRHPAIFRYQDPADNREYDLSVFINSAERESGSGNTWNLECSSIGGHSFSIFFNTKNRTGTLTRH